MRVLVTGGTGFVGSHLLEALAAAGHELRLLARSRARAEALLKARGIRKAEIADGDMGDAGAVRAALEGCDAVIHAAAAVEIEKGRDSFDINTAGQRNVLATAVELGLDPVVAVSSIAALFPAPGPEHRVDDPVASLSTAYGRSKAEGEHLARALQERGAPVVIVYPSGVYGPDDPAVGITSVGLRDRVRYGWPITTGGSAIVDVRDLAAVLGAVLEPGRGPRRYMAGGHFLPWAAEADLVEALVGRKVRRVKAPPRVVRAFGRLVDGVKRIRPSFEYPLTLEAARILTQAVPCDSRATQAELGVRFRPVEETLEDHLRWLVEVGQLKAEEAPRLATQEDA